MDTMIHPEFQKALALGHIIPVKLPNGDDFVVDGIRFYQATGDGANMYQGRAMAFTDVIEKHNRLKLDEATIRAFFASVGESATQAMLLIGSDPEKAVQFLSDIASLANFGKQRLDLYDDIADLQIGSNTARVYELASIWFFGSDEDPAAYDPTKGKRNIELWLKYPELYDFFLRLRLNQFAPLAAHSPESTLKSIQAMEEMDAEGFYRFSQTLLRLKTTGAKLTSIQYLEYQTGTLRAYGSCYAALWKNLTTTWPQASENSSTTLSS